jgi:hypothetical protein
MALATQFDRDLKKLFNMRTAWLRIALGKESPGKPTAFARSQVMPQLGQLVLTARKILLKKRGRREFQNAVVAKRQWHVRNKGWGRPAKKKSFGNWYERNVPSHNCVYVFWSGRRCEYVGRTINGKGRPSSSFEKFWFSSVTRIDIYSVSGQSLVPKAECLAIDLLNPRRNVYSSSRPKFSKKCPICSAEKNIQRELISVFPFRKTRKRK